MTLEETIKIASAILLSLGSGGVIVFTLSNWLGKLWAERIMSKERANYESELAALRARLEKENQQILASLKTDLEIYRDSQLKGLSDKMASYRLVIDVLADVCADIFSALKRGHIESSAVDKFHRGRMKAFGYLAMLASQEVLDRFAVLTDYVEDVAEGKIPLNLEILRKNTFEFANAMRKDVGISPTEIKWGENFTLPHIRN